VKALLVHRILRTPQPASTPLVAVVLMQVTGFMYLLYWFFMITAVSAPWNHLAANAWLMAVLAASFLGWSVVRRRGRVTAATGGGFVVAAFALLARIQGETLLSFADVPWREDLLGAHGREYAMLARYGGFVAFVFGLAMVAAACLAERRLQRPAASGARRAPIEESRPRD